MKFNKYFFKSSVSIVLGLTLVGCSNSFLEQKPLSFYEPSETYTTEEGLKSALAMCDEHLKDILMDGYPNNLPMITNYIMTDEGLYAKTDVGGSFMDNFDKKITPTSGMDGGGDTNYMQRFWDEGYKGVKDANTVLSYIDQVQGLSDTIRNAYKGRAYFHRALSYYYLVLQFGDIPLVAKIPVVPKLNYKSTSKEAIFEMLVHDLEFAVQHVPIQSDMSTVGAVNKEACMQLLAKCYLVTGQYANAEKICTDLINNYGHHLMTEPFGTKVVGNEKTWPVVRNVMWDLFRGENICDDANKEMLMPILNFDSQNFTNYPIMRACFAMWNSNTISDPSGVSPGCMNFSRTDANYNEKNDWIRVIGRGIGSFRTSYYYNKTIWDEDGQPDYQDMRHNSQLGNWVEMEDLCYNNPKSPFYGQHLQLYATKDCVDSKGNVIVHKGDLLCGDTIRCWYPIPLYKCYILDKTDENNLGATSFVGATTGSNGNLYLFRLAETYLIRAEARFYQGNTSGATEDVNVIRRRANARYMYKTVTIGDIVDERARELYMEEWRQAELVRVSWCLAKSGKADEWGETYNVNTWDKQDGTDLKGGSYWYKRCTRYNLFNHGSIQSNGVSFNYVVNKHNLFWPVPNSAITANTGAALRQNYGYDGYNDATPMFADWHKAVADEIAAE